MAVEDEAEVSAVLGGERRPTLRLSELLTEYAALQSATLARKSDDQKRKWRNPKQRAITNLIEVIGDKPLVDITRADAVSFRRWWQDRCVADSMTSARRARTLATSRKCCTSSSSPTR